MDLHLDPHHPPSADYTRQVADGMAEAVRVLNHATMHPDALPHPSTVYTLVGSLREGTAGLPQLLRQIETRLREWAESGRLADDSDDPAARRADAEVALTDARGYAAVLTRNLDRLHQATSTLYLREGGGQ
ncbi:hypothetical protein [Thermoactinospora rubra]|uniref:hypothetical protein n=1 Tax=Thermoactinospora rubra TaxID=1088767 RepID=UPI000A109D5A|nr:hypothetical protein [Thermoactinospora rubra]